MKKTSNRIDWKVGDLFILDFDEWIIYEILEIDNYYLACKQAFIDNGAIFTFNPISIIILSNDDLIYLSTKKIMRIITNEEKQQIELNKYLKIASYEKIV